MTDHGEDYHAQSLVESGQGFLQGPQDRRSTLAPPSPEGQDGP